MGSVQTCKSCGCSSSLLSDSLCADCSPSGDDHLILPLSKTCRRCGCDVVGAARMTDAAGNDYCRECWEQIATRRKLTTMLNRADGSMAGTAAGSVPRAEGIGGTRYPGSMASSAARAHQTQAVGTAPIRRGPPPPPASALVGSSAQRSSAFAPPPAYPCRSCSHAFAYDDVYSEPDGRTICKTCWAAEIAVPPPTIVAPGLELVDDLPADVNHDAAAAPLAEHAPAAREPDQPQLFCESCFRICQPYELNMQAGKVICRSCIQFRKQQERRSEEAASAAARAEKFARQQEKKRQRDRAKVLGGGSGISGRKAFRMIRGIIFIVGGLSGTLALRGTHSGLALAAVGFVMIVITLFSSE